MPSSRLDRERRARDLAAAAEETADVVVVGGGITGAGVALDAVTRGLSVTLLEREDLAHGTSRWSSKLVHGGLRYLARGDVDLVWESAVERHHLVTRIAPHLVRPLPFLIPVLTGGSPATAALALAGTAAGSAFRWAAGTAPRLVPAARPVGPRAARALVPALPRQGLRGGVVTWDSQLVDDARLVVAVARTAAAHGARIVTRCAVDAVASRGVRATDRCTGEPVELAARVVVNATGIWAGDLDARVTLAPSRGSHLVLDGARLGNPPGALAVPVPGMINRLVFALPQHDGRVLVGLTDDAHVGPLPPEPTATAGDVDFLLQTLSLGLQTPLEAADVRGTFAGFRPLLAAGAGGASADLSRHHRVLTDGDGPVSVVGGKLTTWRRMAQDTVDAVAARLPGRAGPCRTREVPLVGAAGPVTLAGLHAPPHLVARYGTEAAAVQALAERSPQLARRVVAHLPYLAAELAWGARAEGALTPEDLVDRRTRLGWVAADRAEALAVAAELLAG